MWEETCLGIWIALYAIFACLDFAIEMYAGSLYTFRTRAQ